MRALFGPAPPWPPEFAPGERVLFEGSFDPAAWAKEAAFWFVLLVALLSLLPSLMGAPDVAVPLLPFVGACAVAAGLLFLVHRDRDWVMTDRALYISGVKPIEKARIRRFGGWGATITIITGHGTNRRLLGVRRATTLRHAMNGALL